MDFKQIFTQLSPEQLQIIQEKAPEFIKMISEKMGLIRTLEETWRAKHNIPADEILIYSALPVIRENTEENDIVIYVFSVKQITEEIKQGAVTIPAGSMVVTNQVFKFNALSFARGLAKDGIKGVMDLFIDQMI